MALHHDSRSIIMAGESAPGRFSQLKSMNLRQDDCRRQDHDVDVDHDHDHDVDVEISFQVDFHEQENQKLKSASR